MYRQNYRKFRVKRPSLIRTTDTKSQPLGANSYKINLFVTDTPGTNRGPGVDNLRYVPLTLSQTAIPIPEHVKMFFSKLTFIIANTVIENTVAIASSIRILYALLFCTVTNDKVMYMKNIYVNCVTIYVN